MKKLFIIAILLTLGAGLHAQTTVSGGIYANTTWTKANSPYLVTSELVVFSAETLTIEPGVTVLFSPNVELDIRGALIAVGTKSDSITFTSSQVGSSSFWTGISTEVGSSINIRHCYFSNATEALNTASYEFNIISNCTFENNNIGVLEVYPATIDSCSFIGNTSAVSDIGTVKNSYFISNYTAITYADTILNNYIKGSHIAILLNGYTYGGITGNTIIENDTGIFIENGYQISIEENIICHNNYNIVLNASTDYYVQKNCWCLADSTAIQATIYDGHTNINEGLVHFVPFNTCTDPDPGYVTAITASQNQLSSFITIAPNPNSGSFNVQLQNTAAVCTYSVYDNKGTTISTGSIGASGTINLPGATPGIYYLVVFSDQQTYTEKVVVE